MTDRIKSLTVILANDIREDDAQPLIDAIKLLNGVVGVGSHVKNSSDIAARAQVLDLIKKYGSIDESHHKQWLLDQVVQALSFNYTQWVKDYQEGEDDAETYKWDVGIAP